MALPFPPPSTDDWAAEIAEAAGELMGAIISVYLPGDPANQDEDGYSPPSVVLSRRRARVQHLKATRELNGEVRPEKRRNFRIQIDLTTDLPIIGEGMFIRVDDADRDPSLEQYVYSVVSAVNSSNAALRTIECVSDMTVTPPVVLP